MSYKKVLLKDIAEVIMGSSPKSEFYSDVEGTPFLQGTRTFGRMYPEIDTYTTKVTRMANKDDILFSVRAPVGDINFAPTELCIGRGLSCIKPISVNKEFLYYLLIGNIKMYESKSTGTIFSSINKKELENLEFKIPSFYYQKKIGDFLWSIDSKIEVNNSIISNLEELAQTLFKHWFVDFEFPNEEGKPYKLSGGKMIESELGIIPNGWEVKSLSEIANFQNGLAMQKFRPGEGEDSLPVLKIKELRQGFTDYNSDLCSTNIKDSVKVYDGDVIFSWSATLLVKLWVGGNAGLNQHLFKVTSEEYSKWFYYLWTKHYLDLFNAIAQDKATTMGHIKRSHLDESKVIVPSEEHYIYFDSVFNRIIEQKINLLKENKSLIGLRDTLLPKLLSGEIELPEDMEVRDDVPISRG